MRRSLGAAALALSLLAAGPGRADDFSLGVYYYPGWHEIARGLGQRSDPWDPIRAFPERRPLLGWYDDSPDVLRRQAEWMRAYAIDYVVFDWYFENGRTHLNGPLDAYRELSAPRPAFAIMWANHGGAATPASWEAMVGIWVRDYLANEAYLKIDGRPVVFIYSAERLAADATAAGGELSEWLGDARRMIREQGRGEVFFVAGVSASTSPIVRRASEIGFDAVTAYNFRGEPDAPVAAHGFAERDRAYRSHWSRLVARTDATVILPMTSGWDRRPWGGSEDPARDDSMPTPGEFRAHLNAARAFARRNDIGIGVVCCWNEFGEGSYVEPTEGRGFRLLEQMRAVFGRRSRR